MGEKGREKDRERERERERKIGEESNDLGDGFFSVRARARTRQVRVRGSSRLSRQ